MRQLRPASVGLLLGLLASVLWGTVFVAGRYLVDVRGLDPIFVAAMRFNTGAVAALAYLFLTGKARALREALPDLPLLTLLGAIGIFGMGCMVFLSVRYTASINSAIILNANPVFIAIFAPLVGERVPGLRILGLLIGLLGCIVISLGELTGAAGGSNDLLGCSLAVLGACFWAAYTVFGRGVSQRRGGLASATLGLLTGGLLYIPVLAIRGGVSGVSPQELVVALYLGVFPTAIAMLAWFKALEFVEANVLGPTQYLATLVSTLLGWWLLAEHIGLSFALGGAAIVAGLWLATKPARPP